MEPFHFRVILGMIWGSSYMYCIQTCQGFGHYSIHIFWSLSIISCIWALYLGNILFITRSATVWAFLSSMTYASGQFVHQFTKLTIYTFPLEVSLYGLDTSILTFSKGNFGTSVSSGGAISCLLLWTWHTTQFWTWLVTSVQANNKFSPLSYRFYWSSCDLIFHDSVLISLMLHGQIQSESYLFIPPCIAYLEVSPAFTFTLRAVISLSSWPFFISSIQWGSATTCAVSSFSASNTGQSFSLFELITLIWYALSSTLSSTFTFNYFTMLDSRSAQLLSLPARYSIL